MLLNINIKNFLLIEELNLDLDKGLIVITGETGAGKSMIIDAILYALGAKGGNIIIQKEAAFCFVTLTFQNSDNTNEFLNRHDIDLEDNLIITRGQNINGKKKIVINGQVVSIKLLQELAEKLLDIYGQNTHTDLFLPKRQLEIIDQYAHNDELKKQLLEQYRIWYDANKKMQEFEAEKTKIQDEIEYLKLATSELEKAELKIDEENKLTLERIELQKKIRSTEALGHIMSLLQNDAMNNNLISAEMQLLKLSDSKEFVDAASCIEQALINIDRSIEILSATDQEANLEANLAIIEERLFCIRDLSRKYRVPYDKLQALLEEYEQKLQILQQNTAENEQIKLNLNLAKKSYLSIAKEISVKRCQAALTLEEKINKELKALEMIFAKFFIDITHVDVEKISPSGLDIITFMGTMNPGSPSANIAKIASGGELSRLMLAIMTSFAAKAKKPLIIFDEIDSGTSGVAAGSIAAKLKNLSNDAQVIVITHQAQIAAKADQHLFVFKKLQQDITVTNILTIEHQNRATELARMIAGTSSSQEIYKAALAMMTAED